MAKSLMAGLRITGRDNIYSKELTITHPSGFRLRLSLKEWAQEEGVVLSLEELSSCCGRSFGFQTSQGLISRWERGLTHEGELWGHWVCGSCRTHCGRTPKAFRGEPKDLHRLEEIIATWLTPYAPNSLSDVLMAFDLRVLLETYCDRVGIREEDYWGFSYSPQLSAS